MNRTHWLYFIASFLTLFFLSSSIVHAQDDNPPPADSRRGLPAGSAGFSQASAKPARNMIETLINFINAGNPVNDNTRNLLVVEQSGVRNKGLKDFCGYKHTKKIGVTSASNDLDALCGRPEGFSKAIGLLPEEKEVPKVFESINDIGFGDASRKFSEKLVTERDAGKLNDKESDQATKLEDIYHQTEKRSAILPLAVGQVAQFVVKGLGDFMKEHAKQELTAYVGDTLGKKLCGDEGDIAKFLVVNIDGKKKKMLESSCAAVYPAGIDSEIDYDAFTDGRMQKAFFEDVARLPVMLIYKLGEKIKQRDPELWKEKTGEAWIKVAEAVVRQLMLDIQTQKITPGRVLIDLDKSIEDGLTPLNPKELLKCSLKSGQLNPICATLLGIRLAAKTADAVLSNELYNEYTVILVTVSSFCESYGDPSLSDDPYCGLSELKQQFEAEVKSIIEGKSITRNMQAEALKRNVEVFRYIQTHLVQAEQKMASDPKTALKQFGDAFIAVLKEILTFARSADVPQEDLWFIEGATFAAEAASAILNGDLNSAIVDLKDLLMLKPISEKLNKRTLRAIKFVLSLGSVKDATEAKTVIEEFAEPLGSYREKYANDFVLSLNGMVGPAAGELIRMHDGSQYEDSLVDLKPLAGLVGLDFSWSVCGKNHLGFMVTAIDALGMIEVTDTSDTDIDWAGVVALGLTLRWGIFNSPIVLFISGQWQPLRRSADEDANGDPLWKGAFAGYVGIAIDIPIFTLYTK